MKDKEMIEEMAKDLKKHIDKTIYGVRCSNEIEKCVTYLVNKGYRKIDKDSVVLSREDKAKCVHIDTLKNIKSISQLKELLSTITAINDLMGYNDRELEIRQEERKETAEKWKVFIKSLFNDGWFTVADNEKVHKVVDEFAKQFGVEINDNTK